MSDELPKNYEIFHLEDENFPLLILRRFCHSVAQQNEAVSEELRAMNYKGWVLLDNLFKGGNTSQRFAKWYFEGEFSGSTLVVHVEKSHPVRRLVSDYLREKHYVEGTGLRQEDIDTILNGGVI